MELLARSLLTLLGPADHEDDTHDRHHEGGGNEPESFLIYGRRRVQATLVEEERIKHIHAIARRRQGAKDGEIPEKKLQKQRDVAQGFDIDGGHLGDQPVVGEPGDADDESEDGRQDDADEGDDQGVDQADQECAAVSVFLAVFDEVHGDAEPGRAFEKIEARRDALPLQVGDGVVDQVEPAAYDGAEDQDLEEDGADLGVVPERGFRRRLGFGR